MLTAEELYIKYEKLALNECRKYSGKDSTTEDREDLQQEARLALWKACLETNSQEECEFTKYVIEVVTNHLLMLKRSARTFTKVAGTREWIDIDEYWRKTDPLDFIENRLDHPEEWETVLNDKDLTSKIYMEVSSFELIRKAELLSNSNDVGMLRKHIVKWLSLMMFACKARALNNQQRAEIEGVLIALKLDSDENIKWNIKRQKNNHQPKTVTIELYS